MLNTFDDQIEIFFGEATPSQARVYARLPRGAWPPDAKLHGTISGPTCMYAQTLPATYRFRNRGPGDKLVAEAIVPDPCFWTPRLPYLYQLEIELRQGSEVLAHAQRPFGIRPLGAKGNSLSYSGKRWVLRGGLFSGSSFDFPRWHVAETAMVVTNPKEPWCAEASRVGVLMIVRVDVPSADLSQVVHRLVRHAAVAMLVFDSDIPLDVPAITPTSNCLLAQTDFCGPTVHSEWAHAMLSNVSSPLKFGEQWAQATFPVIACRRDRKVVEIEEIRLDCDRLQAELAPFGDFAGYVV